MNNYRMDMVGNGRRFVDMHYSRALYMTDTRAWFVWDGKRWTSDEGDAQEMAKTVVEAIYTDAKEEGVLNETGGKALTAWARRSAGQLGNILSTAASDPKMRGRRVAMDPDAALLNTPSGIVDLRTGDLLPHDPSKLMTRMTAAPYIEDPKPGLWAEFLDVVAPDPEVQDWLQLLGGYTLVGRITERAMVFLSGGPGTGKSKFVGALHDVLGDYAMNADTGLFLSNARDQYGLADLPGARLVAASEFDEHQKINRTLVKKITTGDVTTVRPIYGKPFPCTPVGTIWVATNEMPFFGDDQASWTRVIEIPFEQHFGYGRFKGDLGKRLLEEAGSEILAWAVRGARDYLAAPGLHPPDSVAARSNASRQEQRHHVAIFLEECFDWKENAVTAARGIRDAYVWWCADNGETAVTQTALGRQLRKAGLTSTRSATHRTWTGGQLRAAAFPPNLHLRGESAA